MEAKARTSDPLTSWQAAASVHGIAETQAKILLLLRHYGPATDEQLISRCVTHRVVSSESGIRSRRAELVRRALVEDSGERGETSNGRACTVWRAVPEAGTLL